MVRLKVKHMFVYSKSGNVAWSKKDIATRGSATIMKFPELLQLVVRHSLNEITMQ